jgi:hypothetical protein
VRRLKGVANVNIVALLVGFGIALWAPLKKELYSPNGGLLWLSSAAFTLGGPLVGMSSLVVGGTLGQTIRRVWLARRAASVNASTTLSWAVDAHLEPTESAPTAETSLGGGAMTPTNSIGTPSAVNSAPTSGCAASDEEPWGQTVWRPSMRDQATLVVTRMVVCPTVCVALLIYTVDYMIPAEVTEINGKLLRLLLVLEAIVPSADFVIVLCIRGGRETAAEALSISYLWQYISGIFTITTGVAVAMSWIGDG